MSSCFVRLRCLVVLPMRVCACLLCLLAVLAISDLLTAAPAARGAAPAAKKKQKNAPSKPAAAASPNGARPSPAPVPMMRAVVIKRVDPEATAAVAKSAKAIDRLVDQNHQKFKIKPTPRTSDEQFVRRVYLDITGTIPTYKQVNAFLLSSVSDKRPRLIDSLLNSAGYVSRMYNYWGDILRISVNVDRNVPGAPYNEWVKRALEENKPYDRLVFDLLTAEGKYWENPATGYVIRDGAMPLDAMSNTLRIFLGTQIGCAQCHNHPFDQWLQKEFYEMAAFTWGTQTRMGGKNAFGGRRPIEEIKDGLKKIDPNFKGGGQYNRMLLANTYAVRDVPGKKLTLPHDYRYNDAKPESVIEPATILGADAPIGRGELPRRVFANWLTSKDNPRFAVTIANRLWKLAMGVGQIEPDDDIREQSVAENDALLKFLTSEMVRLKFDMKEFLRILYNTEAYQRQACFDEIDPGTVYHFPGPALRRMTAEQVWDSFVTLAVFNPEQFQQLPADVEASVLAFDLATATAQEVYDRMQQHRAITGYKARTAREKNYRYKGQLLVRASELPVPLPPGHFLREFGQSDRELIQASSTDGSVPQVLQMFNGPITHMLLEEGSLMYQTVMSKKFKEDRVKAIFLSILSRRPSPEELEIAIQEIRADNMPGYGNVIWSLVNTREFLFVQ